MPISAHSEKERCRSEETGEGRQEEEDEEEGQGQEAESLREGETILNGILEWLGKQSKWYVLLVALIALVALYVFGVPLQEAWGALTGQ